MSGLRIPKYLWASFGKKIRKAPFGKTVVVALLAILVWHFFLRNPGSDIEISVERLNIKIGKSTNAKAPTTHDTNSVAVK